MLTQRPPMKSAQRQPPWEESREESGEGYMEGSRSTLGKQPHSCLRYFSGESLEVGLFPA